MSYFNSLTNVPTDLLERQLDILERLRDRGDFKSMDEYWFYFNGGIPLLGDYSGVTPDFEQEILAVSEELMGRADR